VPWETAFEPTFATEVEQLVPNVRVELLAHAGLLQQFGPQLGRPYCDTLKGSGHGNMKELRFDAEGGVWRVAFAFDPTRKGILLCAGNKKGVKEARFYRRLIDTADERYTAHLKQLQRQKERRK
jgi:hypothetical protein